jgi:hypothetical protein
VTWDGIDRRHPDPPRWDARQILALVLGAAIAIFQAAGLLGHRTLANRQADNAARDETFRRTVSCFLVEITQPETDTDRVEILTRCGLVGTVTNGENP